MNKINLVEILKDCPKGMELDCVIYENAELDCVTNDKAYPIKILIKDDINGNISISLTKEGFYNVYHNPKCVIFPKGKTTWEGFVPPCKFKDGDIITCKTPYCKFTALFKNMRNDITFNYHFMVKLKNGGVNNNSYGDFVNARLATEEEKQKLFDAIKENGYKWNAETKTLDKLIVPKFKVGDRVRIIEDGFLGTIFHLDNNEYKISCDDGVTAYYVGVNRQDEIELVPNKFDITTLQIFDKVLIRDNSTQKWHTSLFEYQNKGEYYSYCCLNGIGYAQCIPYEENKHLLGTTNDCDEYYKTW